MRLYIVIIIVLLFPIAITAQTDKVAGSSIKAPSLVGGIQADAHIAITYAFHSGNQLNLIAAGGVIFIRKHFGEHLALELDINRNYSERTFGEEYWPATFPSSGYVTNNFSYRMKSLEIPLHFQFHMGKRDAGLRPYVGLGIGYAAVTSYIGYKDYITGAWGSENTDTYGRPMIQLTQGITYRVGNRLQINQSLYYKMVHDIGNHRMGLRFGVGYIIM